MAEDDHALDGGGEHAAEHAGGCLGLVDGDDDDGHAGHAEGDDAADGELGGCGGGCLEDDAAVGRRVCQSRLKK